ncbi:alpha/beta fold hydrolase [Arenibacter sp. GZD96]|uniref:YheT family hydrolase n=1 Tax=Aurantibrevibacter litoralis TaxID=3106030 RepID=UPI002AFE9E5D|nr:alpha/beta fold hydrolase [Arenibacter sp. GZD-96]MEA1785617.1 alpha/beta fold hydrolase [Arenibacter sp. GZD-96]
MPLVTSAYNPPLLFRNGHWATIYAGTLRKVTGLLQERERIPLPDGDFLDLDWSFAKEVTSKVVILLHGLEGSAQRPYITGSAKQFNKMGYDACAVNFRGCSGEPNLLFRSYHSGATEDLEAVIHYILETKSYSNIVIKGFSLGGNLALKYLGEGRKLPKEITGAVAVSVPCHLHSSLLQLLKPKNWLYARRFKTHLVEKLTLKQTLYPHKISKDALSSIRTLKDFDDVYTSKAHGFSNALEYYEKCSCLQFLSAIKIPVLLINAKNDSFLGKECYPLGISEKSDQLYLEMPNYGGHVGFYGTQNSTYTEQRAIEFLKEVL